MATKLSEMSLEELWQLFPIVLTEHREEWAQWYEEERDFLSSMLPGNALFYHIGSTAIDNIWAKPIVDILIEFPSVEAMQKARDILASNGYLLMCEDAARISFNKGYTENGFAVKVFHIHLRIAGDNDEILFRDYMNAHPEEAEEYEKLKLGLWKKFEHNRDAYTDSKTDFVRRVVAKAVEELNPELLDIVDENGCPVGETVTRGLAHLKGIRHRTSHVWFVRRRGGKLQILLQKRCKTKASFPGCYDISSAGHIPAGVDHKESAVREIKEELGINVSQDELVECGDRTVIWDDCFNGMPYHDRQVSRVYCIIKDIDEDGFSLQKEELESLLWMDFDECVNAVRDNTIKHCIYLNELYMVREALEKML